MQCVFENDTDPAYVRCVRGGCKRRMPREEDVPLDQYDAKCRGTGPDMIEKAVNLAKATAKHVATGAKTVTDEVAARRSSICLGCNLFVKELPPPDYVTRFPTLTAITETGYCGHKSCGCQTVGVKEFMAKQRWEESKCPHPKGDKWRMTDEQLKECGHPEKEGSI